METLWMRHNGQLAVVRMKMGLPQLRDVVWSESLLANFIIDLVVRGMS
jgi:hypothetical protein